MTVTAALTDFDIPALEARFVEWGFRPAHAARLLKALYRGNGSIDLVSLSLGKRLMARMADELLVRSSEVIARHVSGDGTSKLLVGFRDGNAVETVLMPSHRQGIAAGCVSSQVGCAMGCDFCASTRGGLVRNLTAGEIVEQFLHLRAAAASVGRRVKTLVFMGMGEPLSNLENVVAAIERITDRRLGALGRRQITVSTVGIVPGIDRLAEADLNVHLALSLHAPDDQTRSRIVPPNKRYPLSEIMAATRRFLQRSGRVPTIEYCMLAGVNDSDAQAALLADLMQGLRAHVNLIPYNAIGAGISGAVYARPSEARLRRFIETLRDRGVVAHFRTTRGDDVAAACGQLRQTQGQMVQLSI
ncbi:MAG TPA: 23S rRNA (adenine(2503)-C(2))-methyltransferase RlmN [Tepidisphaeraceae bacterium]|nr:23S rRNA (adenine(2503)-C(2))-methyltransferase RlmN [Tepidisphaeraceae bacterium]